MNDLDNILIAVAKSLVDEIPDLKYTLGTWDPMAYAQISYKPHREISLSYYGKHVCYCYFEDGMFMIYDKFHTTHSFNVIDEDDFDIEDIARLIRILIDVKG